MGLSEREFYRLTPAKFSVLFGRIVARDKNRLNELKTFDAWFARQAALAQEAINVQCRSEENKIPLALPTAFLLFKPDAIKTVEPTVLKQPEYDLEAERAKWKGWVVATRVKNSRKS
jgi:hypothetical protein